MEDALRFAAQLDLAPDEDGFLVDGIALQHVPPFGMLFTAAALRQFVTERRKRNAEVAIDCVNYDVNSFACHMGFWQSAGIPHGKAPGEAAGKDHYLPITKLDIAEIRRKAKIRGIHHAALLDENARILSTVLCQDTSEQFITTAAYALREVFRNAVEHSHAEALWYCAQFWPNKDLVEIAILDEGRGIRKSLFDNPLYRYSHELQAVRKSLERGVTRFVPSIPDIADVNAWDHQSYGIDPTFFENSGWGLYVLREITRSTGSIAVISNNSGLYIAGSKEIPMGTCFRGTAVRLLLRPSRIGNLLERLLKASGRDRLSKFSPSLFAKLS